MIFKIPWKAAEDFILIWELLGWSLSIQAIEAEIELLGEVEVEAEAEIVEISKQEAEAKAAEF